MGNRTICFFNSNKAWGGGEKWHYETALWMRNKGFGVIVFACKDQELYKRSIKAGFETYPIQLSNFSFLNPIKMLGLKRKLKALKPDCIILNLSADVKAAGLTAKWAGIQNILYRRGMALPVKASVVNKHLFKNVLTKIIVNSEDIKNKLLQNHLYLKEINKVEIVYNGIPIEKIKTKSGIHNGNKIIIGNVGRLVEQKAQHVLIEMAKKLKQAGADFEVQIVGSGRLDGYLKNYSKQLNVEGKIKFLGYQKDLRLFYKSIDVFVMTSLHEGTSNAMIEAMGNGLPIVAFDVSSMPEMVMNNSNGFLVPLLDNDFLTDKVKMLIDDKEMRDRMGGESIALVKQKFDKEKNLKNLISFAGLNS